MRRWNEEHTWHLDSLSFRCAARRGRKKKDGEKMGKTRSLCYTERVMSATASNRLSNWQDVHVCVWAAVAQSGLLPPQAELENEHFRISPASLKLHDRHHQSLLSDSASFGTSAHWLTSQTSTCLWDWRMWDGAAAARGRWIVTAEDLRSCRHVSADLSKKSGQSQSSPEMNYNPVARVCLLVFWKKKKH